ncbi:hypothetical protein NQ314_006174 [Rhamnusium bicolor]|uniref:Uncharacterized protein n=1 Tax=Rhamnusium bicolor TaxID=1586634 RepID=A0AAV8Z6A5_9CUCU|nr:hypothetical protein NQ314_006174 [Rhamnusium bicolor]
MDIIMCIEETDVVDVMTIKRNQKNKIVTETCHEDICVKHLDLTSFNSVKCFAKELTRNEEHLDVLINNAGVFCMKHKKTCDGLDAVMQVNHFGPFLLTHLLTDLLKKSDGGRIIFITSTGAFLNNLNLQTLTEPMTFSPDILATAVNYYNSKLCNMISSIGFARKLESCNVTCNCLHPGMTNTDFMVKVAPDDGYIEKMAKKFTKEVLKYTTRDVVQAVGLCTFLATSDSVKHMTGKFFVDYQVHSQPRVLEDNEFCTSIWNESEMLTGVNCEEKSTGQNLGKKKFLL